VRLVEDSTPGEIARSHELLREVAERRTGPTARIYRPRPTVAFGRLDARAEGFAAASEAARAHGFEPVVRVTGGHAAAYTGAAVVYDEITPTERLGVEVGARFERMASVVAAALSSLGVDARIGELPGEYCPGEWSVNAGGRVKLAGIAQRVVARAALVSAVIVVGDGGRVRAVLTDVYARLGLDWDPSTAGAVDDVAPGVDARAVSDALIRIRFG
jgi:lipoate-protein ligase A